MSIIMSKTGKRVTLDGSKIKAVRKSIKPELTQEAVAEKMKMSRAAMNQWEKASEKRVDFEEAERLAKILKVSVADLEVSSGNVQEVETTYTKGNDIEKALKRLDQLSDDALASKERTINLLVERLKKADEDSLFLKETIRELTKGFSTLKKA